MAGQSNSRTWEQLKEHYEVEEVEKELASRLRNASRDERQRLYSAVYDELYRRVRHHPRNTRRLSADDTARAVRSQLFFLRRFLHRKAIFLEVGPGDCSLSLEVAKFVETVYAVDVSAVATSNLVCPHNLAIITYDGINIRIEHNTVNISYSHSVMEHLHPDDARAQLQSVYNVLAPGGLYICVTPNRLYGPTDISGYFDDTPTGMHLKEYTVTDLSPLMRQTGFSKVRVYAGGRGLFYVPVPFLTVALCEMLLGLLPHAPRRAIAGTPPLRALLGVRLVATK